MCIDALLTRMPVHHMHAWSLERTEVGIKPLRLELQNIVSHVGAGHQTWSLLCRPAQPWTLRDLPASAVCLSCVLGLKVYSASALSC